MLDAGSTGVFGNHLVGLARFERLLDMMGNGTSKNNNVQ